MSEEIKKALDAVALHGVLQYPVGSARAHLCHAAVVLAPEVVRLEAKVLAMDNIVGGIEAVSKKHNPGGPLKCDCKLCQIASQFAALSKGKEADRE